MQGNDIRTLAQFDVVMLVTQLEQQGRGYAPIGRQETKKPRLHWVNGAFGGLCWTTLNQFLAEQAGFEPAVSITLRTLSRRVT